MQKINIVTFTILLSLFFALAILPSDPRAAELEHLASFPDINVEDILNKNFSDGFENYLGDNMALRSFMIEFARGLDYLQGLQPASGFVEIYNNLMVFTDRIMEIFVTDEVMSYYFSWGISEFAVNAREDARIFNMVVPNAAAFLSEPYSNMTGDQRQTLIYLDEWISILWTNRMILVDVYSKLKEHQDEYIFFRTDHHWTALGAYYAYLAFCEAAGLEPVPLSEYNEHRAENFLGLLYNQRPSRSLRENADTIIYYTLNDPAFDKLIVHPTPNRPPTYQIFMGGDHGHFVVETQNKNNKTVVVLKDSYANCFVPFLVPHYERIVVLDPRHVPEDFSIIGVINSYENVDFIMLHYILSTTMSDIIYLLNHRSGIVYEDIH